MKKAILNIIENDLLYWIIGGFSALYFLYHLALALIDANI